MSYEIRTTAAHLLIYILAAALATRIATWFGLLFWVNGVAALILLTCWVAAVSHRRQDHLCARCMDDVPADAPTRAERQRTVLRISHFANTIAGVATMGILLVGPPVAAKLMNTEFSPWLAAPGDLWLSMVIFAEWTHHRLRPWCPYCEPWDDEGEPEPVPDPTILITKMGD